MVGPRPRVLLTLPLDAVYSELLTAISEHKIDNFEVVTLPPTIPPYIPLHWTNHHGVCVEWFWNGKPTYCKKNLSQCYFAHHDPHVDCPEIEPRPPLASLFWFPMPLCHGCLRCRRNETYLAWHQSCWVSAPEMYPLRALRAPLTTRQVSLTNLLHGTEFIVRRQYLKVSAWRGNRRYAVVCIDLPVSSHPSQYNAVHSPTM